MKKIDLKTWSWNEWKMNKNGWKINRNEWIMNKNEWKMNIKWVKCVRQGITSELFPINSKIHAIRLDLTIQTPISPKSDIIK